MIHSHLLIYSFIASFYTVFALILWFEGDVTMFFQKLLRNPKWLKRNEYDQYIQSEDLLASYPEFLYEKYPSFITKILSCPICLTFWSTLVHSILIFKLNFIFILPVSYYISLFLYLSIKKLLQ